MLRTKIEPPKNTHTHPYTNHLACSNNNVHLLLRNVLTLQHSNTTLLHPPKQRPLLMLMPPE